MTHTELPTDRPTPTRRSRFGKQKLLKINLIAQDWEAELRVRLQAGGDVPALLDLYDRTAKAVYSYALHRTGTKALARALSKDVFLEAWENPSVLNNDRLPIETRMLMIVHLRSMPVAA